MADKSTDQRQPAPRVLVVIGQLELGGTERHLGRVLPALQSRGIEVAVFPLRAGGAITGVLQAGGVRVFPGGDHPSRWRRLWQAACGLRQACRDFRPDVLHFFLPAAYLFGSLVTLGIPARRMMSRRSLAHYQRRYPGLRWVESKLHQRLDAVLANSRAVLEELRREAVPEDRLCLVYNGVEPPTQPLSRLEARAQLGLANSTFVLLTVANLIAYKGHADLIEALGRIAPQLGDDWCLLCAGRDDGLGAALHAQASRLGIADRIRWLGSVAGVETLWQAADVAVQPSHEEGFSNAVIEAMLAGLPLVLTAVGGNPEAVEEGVSGLLVPPRNPPALAEAILRLFRAPDERRALGSAAALRAGLRYTLDRCVAAYAEIYARVCRGELPAGSISRDI